MLKQVGIIGRKNQKKEVIHLSNETGNIMKVVNMGLDLRVFEEMKRDGFSAEALSRKLKTEGKEISAQSIRKFIKKSKKAQQELIQKDIHTAEILKTQIMDYSKALKEILTEVQEVKDEAKTEKDFTTYNQLVGRLMQGIELIAKLSGDLKPKGSIDINIIYNEINTDVEKKMSDLKDKIVNGEVIDVDAEIIEEDSRQENKLKGEKK